MDECKLIAIVIYIIFVIFAIFSPTDEERFGVLQNKKNKFK